MAASLVSCSACDATAAKLLCHRCTVLNFCSSRCRRSKWQTHRAKRKCPCDVGSPTAEAGVPLGAFSHHPGQLVVQEGALPAKLADDVYQALASVPTTCWQRVETKDQPLGMKSIPMRFHRLDEDVDIPKKLVIAALTEALSPQPSEKLLLNFSKYEPGDFLNSHCDTPSGNPSYERRQAFIWHLAKDWNLANGGVFIDEEDEQGARQIIPAFNTLVTFPVPRKHSVTKVIRTTPGQARFAAFGWIVVPCIRLLSGLSDLFLLLRSARSKAVVILVARAESPLSNIAGALAHFEVFPVQEVGKHYLGELCVFARITGDQIMNAFGIPHQTDVAVAVFADPSGAIVAFEDVASATRIPSGAFSICTDMELLSCPRELRRFVDFERKVYSPCRELDTSNSLLMSDMCSSTQVKVFVFLAQADRTFPLIVRLNDLAASFKRRLQIFLADANVSRHVMEDYGLTLRDVPTAVADDTMGKLGTRRFKDGHVGGISGLNMEQFAFWVQKLARDAVALNPQLR